MTYTPTVVEKHTQEVTTVLVAGKEIKNSLILKYIKLIKLKTFSRCPIGFVVFTFD